MNQSILYWKWDDASLAGGLAAKTADLTARYGGDNIAVGIHWVRREYDELELQNAIAQTANRLHAQGKRLHVETCLRNEGTSFFRNYPSERAWLTICAEVQLDAEGRGEIALDVEPVYHYWRAAGQNGPERVFGGWAFTKTGEGFLEEGSIQNILSCCRIETRKDNAAAPGPPQLAAGGSGVPEDAAQMRCVLKVDAGNACALLAAAVVVGTPQPIPDLASPCLMEHYERMLATAAAAGVDGVISDEWGYDVILAIHQPNPYDDKTLHLRHLSLSDNISRWYGKLFPGCRLYDDLIWLYYAPENTPQRRVAAINRYIATLRDIMRQNDEDMYAAAKRALGPNAFYGVHPTWWGSADSLNFEVFKNGWYWWEAKRDIAQTDETVSVPIRTAMAHKWGGPIWYNMWYSMGTRDIKTYFRDTWNSLRYGGRTHILGYECPNEPVVLPLSPPGMLEQIEDMDALVRQMEPWQGTQPDCRVLLLFGMEAATNWALVGAPKPPWIPENPVQKAVLRAANDLNNLYLCDLVPSTEIVNGSLRLDSGQAVYGNQRYDAVVLLAPESLDLACFNWLRALTPNTLAVCGHAHMDNTGHPLTPENQALLGANRVFDTTPEGHELAPWLAAHGVRANRYENGCVFQDGSLLFTAIGEKSSGNPLAITCTHKDVHIQFQGLDCLWLKFEEGETRVTAFSPQPGVLTLNAQPVQTDGQAQAIGLFQQ